MTKQKFKFNVISKDGKEEAWTGIFENEELADKWYNTCGVVQKRRGHNLIKRKAYTK